MAGTRQSPIGVLMTLLAAVAFFYFLDSRGSDEVAAPACPEGAECEEASAGRDYVSSATLVLDRSEVCPGAGYLCAKLTEEPEMRLLRWPDTNRTITVDIPLPPGETPGRATKLRQAVRSGVLAWDGYPMAIRVRSRSAGGEPADITVRWADGLTDNRLGQARTEWLDVAGRISFRVADFALVTHNPYDRSVPLSSREVELTAAHEMGHALGIPHSDSEHDVMFPENTAVRLTARDYRTVQSLYDLPGGARIR